MQPYVIGIYGQSNTGKTTLVSQILQKLTKEGYHIATIKQTDKNIHIDCKGKDTWRHHDAGASITVFSSPIETDILIKKNYSLYQIIQHICMIDSCDCILVEGARDDDIPKIRIGTIKKRPNTLWDYQADFGNLIDYIRKQIARNTKKTPHSLVSIKVNGKDIPLSEFPTTIIKNTIMGLVQSLKGTQDVQNIDIKITK